MNTRRMQLSTAFVLIALVTGSLGCGGQPELALPDVSPTTTTLVTEDGGSRTPPVSTTVTTTAPVSSTTRSAPTTTTVVPGAPLPDPPPRFCEELAVRSGEMMSEIEQVLSAGDDSDGSTIYAILSASRDLLIWTASRVPASLGSEVGALVGIYHNIGVELDRLDPGPLTEARIQGALFTSVFGSSSSDGVDLQLAATRLSAFVNQSCGPGYPLLTSLGALFAVRLDDVKSEIAEEANG